MANNQRGGSGFGAQAGSNIFGALQEALKFYMGLRSQREADTLKQQDYGLRKQQVANDTLQAQTQADTARNKTMGDVLDAYGGQTIRGPYAQQVQNSPYAAALKPHEIPALSARDMALGRQGQESPTIGIPSEAFSKVQEPGAYDVIPSASENYRRGVLATDATNARASANLAYRGQNDAANREARAAIAKQQFNLAQESMGLRARGINISEDQLAFAISRFNTQQDQIAFMNKVRRAALGANPNMMLQGILNEGADGGGTGADLPTAPPPQYYSAPPPAGAGSDWTIAPKR